MVKAEFLLLFRLPQNPRHSLLATLVQSRLSLLSLCQQNQHLPHSLAIQYLSVKKLARILINYYFAHLVLQKFMVRIGPTLRFPVDHGILGFPLILPIPHKLLELNFSVGFLLPLRHSHSMVQHRIVNIHLQTHCMYIYLQENLASFPHQHAQVRSVKSSSLLF